MLSARPPTILTTPPSMPKIGGLRTCFEIEVPLALPVFFPA
jgi:hypothetical protein